MNKLLSNQKKALDKKPATKSKVSPKAPADVASATTPYKSDRKVGGLPEDRYYAASSALDTMGRVAEIQGNKQLAADMHKVAEHKKGMLDAALGGGLKKK